MQSHNRRGIWALVVVALVGALLPLRASAQTPGGEELGICDPIDPSRCLFPFPNDFFTVADADTDTERRVNFNIAAMPRTIYGKPIDPTEWNRNDGFSPGAMMLAHVPGIDLSQTDEPPITDIARSLDLDTDMAVINATTGERHPFWAELDANATGDEQALILRPAVNFEEGARYIVALGQTRDSAGAVIPPSDAFRAYRDGSAAASDPRKAPMEELFEIIEGAGIPRQELFLAWDFTVASELNLAERMLHIRDDAFGNYLGDQSPGTREKHGHPGGAAPEFTIESVETDVNDQIARRVFGTFTVPNYMTQTTQCSWAMKPVQDEINCTPTIGARFNYAGATTADGDLCTIADYGCLPEQNGTLTAPFICIVPHSALSDPASASLYGHGLLGGAEEINQDQLHAFASEHNFVFCATDWMGMAFEDVPNVVTILPEMSNFSTLADRVQQGMLNFLFLGRLMIHPDGFVSDAAFQAPPKPDNPGKGRGLSKPRPVIDTSDLFYDGNSQGGIIGGALTAVAQDFTRAVLGVPGMNYSTLLNRSVDYEGEYPPSDPDDPEDAIPPYSWPTYQAYPSKMDQQLLFALIQMLWDRAEANGYAHHMTDDPYPNTPAHKVLMHVGFSDHQVANVAADVEARTIGAYVYEPAVMAGRHPDVDPYWGMPVITSDPGLFGGLALPADVSAMVIWDNCPTHDISTCRTGTYPTSNIPPREGEDPHERPRRMVNARLQKATFLQADGYIIDVCGGLPCLAYRS
jgi:hypothetical protein